MSKSGYYAWCKRKDEPNYDLEEYLLIKDIFEHGRKKLGYRRITMKLREKDHRINHKKVYRIMKKYGLHTKVRRKNPYRRIFRIQEGSHQTAANLLKQNFRRKNPYQFISTDITYLHYGPQNAYLSVMKDIASGEIVNYKLTSSLDISLSVDLVDDLARVLTERDISLHHVLIHSDQGAHYTSPLYQRKLESYGFTQSMSRRGNCLDNAPVESFFGHFKDEVDYKRVKNFTELKHVVDEYISYYNTGRHQWHRKR